MTVVAFTHSEALRRVSDHVHYIDEGRLNKPSQ